MSTRGKQKRHAPVAADFEPLSRRCLQAAGALSLLLILVVANSLLDGGSASPFNPNPVAAAAERTAEVPGMRIDMTMSMDTEAANPVTITGKGAYNGDTNLAEVVYETTSPQGNRWSSTRSWERARGTSAIPSSPGKCRKARNG